MLQFPVPSFADQRRSILSRYGTLVPGGTQDVSVVARLAAVSYGLTMGCIAPSGALRERIVGWHGPARYRAGATMLCARATLSDETFKITDAAAVPTLRTDPLVRAGIVRSFAGAPVHAAPGHRIGTLCVLGAAPGSFDRSDLSQLTVLADLLSDTSALRARAGQAVLDLIAAERRARRYYDLAMTDGLTGALNRRAFVNVARREVARSARHRSPLSVIALDLDHFKSVNDEHGHAAGDAVLQRLCAAIEATVRDEDVLGRLGGEEFALLLPETALPQAARLADRLRRVIAALRFEADGETESFTVTASLGVAQLRAGEACLENTLLRADRALYAAKCGGRDRVAEAA